MCNNQQHLLRQTNIQIRKRAERGSESITGRGAESERVVNRNG